MAQKEQQSQKNTKKAPAKSLKEKRADKQAKAGRQHHGLLDDHFAQAGDSGSSIPASKHQFRKGARTGCSKATLRCQRVRCRWRM